MEIRPLMEADVPAAAGIGREAFGAPGEVVTPQALARSERRFAHLRTTDPGGAWVAVDDDGALVGAALGIVREGVWGLSFLAVRPQRQARGIGRALLERALAHGDAAGAHERIILSSTDPKAMRRYSRAGLRLRPCVAAGGIADPRRLRPPVADIVATDDVLATADLSRAVRGASHHRDIPVFLAGGMELLLWPERGFAVHDGGTVKLLAARDEEAAAQLLWAALAAAPRGATVGVDFLTAGQDWAIAVLLEAGLALSPDGPVFVGGDPGPMTPYIPSGAYL
jgi:predicted N-acetyltransferase YhbS